MLDSRRDGASAPCTRPPIPAQLIEGHVLSHLDAFVGQDLGSWIGARLAMRTDEQVSLEGEPLPRPRT